jgi:hypothetical protein
MEQLQEKWLFIFCAFSGLTIHSGKIKAKFVVKIDPKHKLKTKPDETKYCPSTLAVFEHQWEPTKCPYRFYFGHLQVCRCPF